MLATVLTGAVVGLDGALVEVEVDIAQSGLPNFLIAGLPDAAVREAHERVRSQPQQSAGFPGLAPQMGRVLPSLSGG
jgi:magnesium chelatase family protein